MLQRRQLTIAVHAVVKVAVPASMQLDASCAMALDVTMHLRAWRSPCTMSQEQCRRPRSCQRSDLAFDYHGAESLYSTSFSTVTGTESKYASYLNLAHCGKRAYIQLQGRPRTFCARSHITRALRRVVVTLGRAVVCIHVCHDRSPDSEGTASVLVDAAESSRVGRTHGHAYAGALTCASMQWFSCCCNLP